MNDIINQLFNHVWQSTAFAVAIAAAAALLRRNSPRLRYWLWLAASVKFLIPFSLIVATGSRVQLPPDTPSLHAVTVQQISTYFAPVSVPPVHATIPWAKVLTAIWLAGVFILLIRWFRRWLTIYFAARRATSLSLPYLVPIFSSPAMIEPGVFGILRPVLLLPQGITDNLTPEQFDAILAHELCHIRYRDNLTAALHMCVETLFWFHPLTWWIGARLTEERERDCDEAVLREGNRPADYARGLVNVCETYIESPLVCASGITGSDLKKRIREIMSWSGSVPITARGKALLAAAALAAVSIPFAIGILRAQTLPPAPVYTYDTVSIHKSEAGTGSFSIGPGPQGGLRTVNTPVILLLRVAYDVQGYQIIGAPGWASSARFDVTFTPDKPDITIGPEASLSLKDGEAKRVRTAQRLQAVLRDRFGLVLRSETRELPIYAMTQAKNGNKLTPHPAGAPGPVMQTNRTQMTAQGVTAAMIATQLSMRLGRPVHDETHLDGQYDFKLSWTPDMEAAAANPAGTLSDPATGASIFTAIQDQLGLRLESTKGPVQVYVVEKIEQPSEN